LRISSSLSTAASKFLIKGRGSNAIVTVSTISVDADNDCLRPGSWLDCRIKFSDIDDTNSLISNCSYDNDGQ
jgi:hypothetical protein